MPGSADITLKIGADGTIEDAVFGVALSSEDPSAWQGSPWEHTVTASTRGKVRTLMADARAKGVTGFRQVNHLLPGGAEVPVEYAAVRVGPDGTLVALGRSLLAVSELQQKLVNAQQALERDYWRLREIETRYRLLFHRSPEAILVVDADSARLVDANPSARRILGLPDPRSRESGERSLPEFIAEPDRESLRGCLRRTVDTGRGEPVRLRPTGAREPLEFRPALLTGGDRPLVLLHVGPASGARVAFPPEVDFREAMERMPDAVVILDAGGSVLWSNRRFLDLVQLRSVEEARGELLGQWLGRPGADLAVLESMVTRHGSVTLFSTRVMGELGSVTDVEISAAPIGKEPKRLVLVMRDVGRRLGELPPATAGLSQAVEALSDELGRQTMKGLVSKTVELVERQLVSHALELTEGNRTAAAELLGLSRQALYSKLARYELDG